MLNHLGYGEGGSGVTFSSLIDQVVHVKLGGCEYKGTITMVGEDFLVVDDNATGTIVLPVSHVKSCGIGEIDEAPLPAKQSIMPESDGYVFPNSFQVFLESLRQTIVRIESAGVNSKLALLLDVLSDYIVLCTIPEGITYMPIMHVQAISAVNADIQPEFSTWAKEYGNKVVHAKCMLDLLKAYVGKSVQLSRDSPEEVSGILCNVDEHSVELVTSPVTRLYVPVCHIKRIDTFERVEWVPIKNG
jgi:hypothetical protein